MQTLKIDIVSDIACPWCAIGFKRLQAAMRELEAELSFELEWHPFELNPDMPPEGEDILPYLSRKYASSEDETRASQARIIAAAEKLGLNFSGALRRRANNTFDAHRVLAWAKEHGRQTAFKMALFEAYFGRAQNPSDPTVLRGVAESLGLDSKEVDTIIASDRYASNVREEEAYYQRAGVSAVPAFIVNGQYLISGAQEPQMLIEALRKIASEAEATA